ncbi:Carbohydrate-binding WSC [Ophiocordyceps sinensis CO18]|uniref:Carbohydrate-binding WSC n=1 Tax=Ophiocordyceps sinensis (strain Co18 / CGMCC 3.14243) TaxID=911162 RepID=T5A7H8_OPHSC|nr:Carbohydrate-binding WSC [Ophiocordyceps sinensis CO18]
MRGARLTASDSEGTTGRALTQGINSVPGAQMTVAKCTAACKASGYPLAGVEYGAECYCGKRISNGAKSVDGGCSMPCKGNSSEFCGGGGRLNVFGHNVQSPTSTSSNGPPDGSATPTACPSQPRSVGDWISYGCYTEATTGRALSDNSYSASDMTLAACAKFCAGHSYFGIEYSRECFCGSKLNDGAAKRPDSECSMVCSGSDCEFCGAGSRLSMYSTKAGGVDPRSTTPGGAGPQVTGLPDGWAAYGCWVDGVKGRILKSQVPDDAKLTLQSCAKTCAGLGYTVAGAEYSRQCFCGNQIVNGGVRAKSESECNSECGGDKTQKCGGPGRMSILSAGEPQILEPPRVIPQVGDWAYQGCVQDNVNQKRTFFWQNFFEANMTPSACLQRCGDFGYMAAGMEYGKECYCGDPANVQTAGAKYVDDSECGIPCTGNASALCGGGSRLTTYFWKGEPFYSWDFPSAGTPEAGSYDLLIGGVQALRREPSPARSPSWRNGAPARPTRRAPTSSTSPSSATSRRPGGQCMSRRTYFAPAASPCQTRLAGSLPWAAGRATRPTASASTRPTGLPACRARTTGRRMSTSSSFRAAAGIRRP